MKKYLLSLTTFVLFFTSFASAQLTLITNQPSKNANNVALNAEIILTFNNNTSLNINRKFETSIIVSGSQTGKIVGTFNGAGTSTITFNPNNDFKPGELVTVTVTAGLGITNPTVFSFTTAVSPESSGVFVKGQKIITTLANSPQRIHAADLDGDGNLDLLSASYFDDKIAWYQNDGLGNFGAQQTISILADGANSVYTADLDGDGDLDVLSTSFIDDKIAWYQNDGLGNFGPQQIISTQANEPNCVFIADLDGDGDMDVLSSSNDNKIAWYQNDGAGNFGPQQTISILANQARSVYAADLDGDGDMDVLSASVGDNKIAWYQNDGAGNFSQQKIITQNVNGGNSVYAADLDGDGDMDVLSASTGDNKIAWYQNDGNGNFSTQKIISTLATNARMAYAADLDGDGDMDVLSASANDDKIAWYQNDGAGNFSQQKIISFLTDNPVDVLAADLDGDGDLDVVSASSFDDKIAWYENELFPISLTATSPISNATGVSLSANIELTFNGTINDLDLNSTKIRVNGNQTGIINGSFSGISTKKILFNPTNNFKAGELITVSITSAVDIINPTVISFYAAVNPFSPGVFEEKNNITTTANGAQSIFSADLDGDGDRDLLSASFNDNKIAWYRNIGSESFSSEIIISTEAIGAKSVYTADIDSDGDLDILSASELDGKIAWYENDGLGNFGPQQIISILADGAKSVFAADLDGDGDQDVLSASFNDNKIAWYQNDGMGNFTPQKIISTLAGGAQQVYAVDIDADGDLDVLSASELDDKIAWYENDGLGNFGPQQIISILADGARSVFAADLDGDGDQDVLSASFNDNKIAWYQNDGMGNFSQQKIITVLAAGATSVYAANIDGGSDIEVLSTSFNDHTIAWYENDGLGNFSSQQIISNTANGAQSVYASDLNSDRNLDVISASFNDDKITWYKNLLYPLISTIPSVNATNIDVAENIVFSFGGIVKNALAIENILVHGSQTGTINGFFSGRGSNELTFNPTNNYKPGELITITIPSTTTTTPKTFTFTTASNPDSDGQFINGQQIITTLTDGATSVYAADLDGDGDLDVISASLDNKIAWYENDGFGNFGALKIITTIAEGAKSVFAADLDGDGDMDVISASSKSTNSKIAWYENDGAGNFGPQKYVDFFGVFATSVYPADLDGDGDLDLLAAFEADNIVSWYANDGTGNFSHENIITSAAFQVKSASAADLDGDGDMDILYGTSVDGAISWHQNNGTGVFGPKKDVGSVLFDGSSSVHAADLDGDGDLDILYSAGWENINWYQNDGTGNFVQKQITSTSTNNNTSVYTADLDGDGDLDIILGYFDSVTWHENDGVGNFSAEQIIIDSNLVSNPLSLYAADLDGDGDLDVLSASIFDDKIAWYKNDSSINTTWKGTTNTNWDVETNWTNGVPDANKVAVLPAVINHLPTINIENALASDILISSGNTLTIAAGKSLTIGRKLDNKGSFNILSDATSNGSLILEGTYIGESTVNYQRYVSDNWHIIASPVKNMPLNGFKNLLDRSGVKYALAPYNNSLASNRYDYFTDATGTNNIDTAGNFIEGKGYSVKNTTDGILELTGSINFEDVSIQLTDNSTTGGNKWNLVGNPFTAPIAINNTAHETNNFLNLNSSKLSPSKVAIYQWNTATNRYDIFNHANAEARYIAPGQGFFVEVKEGGETLTFSETFQSHQSGNLFSKNSDSTPQITLYLSENGVKKATQIKYLAQATKGLDVGYDAGTFSETSNSFDIFTHLITDSEGIDFALQCLPNKDYETLIIPVGISAKAGANINFSAEALNLPSNLTVYLEDKITKKYINLSDGNHSLTLTEDTNGIGRFFLHTASKTLSTETDFSTEAISIYPIENNQIRVIGIPTGKATMTLYNLLGKEVFKAAFEANGVNDVSLPMVATGVYMVLVNTQSGTKTKKIILE